MVQRSLFIFSALMMVSVASAVGQEASPVAKPEEFASKATISGLYEIEAGKLAATKGLDQRVRSFANQMIIDHAEAQKELSATAGKTMLPAAVDTVHAKMLDALRAASPDQFDRLYVDQQVSAHSDAVAIFTGFSTSGPNGALKGLAAKLLPTLQHHQEMIGQLKSKFQ